MQPSVPLLAAPGTALPVAVLGLLWHPSEWRLQAAQVVVELAGVAQHQQVLVLVLLADAAAREEGGRDIVHSFNEPCGFHKAQSTASD